MRFSDYLAASPWRPLWISVASSVFCSALVFSVFWFDANSAANRLKNGVRVQAVVSESRQVERPDYSLKPGGQKIKQGKVNLLHYEYVDSYGRVVSGMTTVSREVFSMFKAGDSVWLVSKPDGSGRQWILEDLQRRANMHEVSGLMLRWAFVFLFFFNLSLYVYRFIAIKKS